MFIGLPVCVMFFIALIRSLRNLYSQDEINAFILSFSVALLITILFAKLELARVASFLIPFIVIISSGEIVKWNDDGSLMNSILLIIAQFIVFFVHISQVNLYTFMLGYPVV